MLVTLKLTSLSYSDIPSNKEDTRTCVLLQELWDMVTSGEIYSLAALNWDSAVNEAAR